MSRKQVLATWARNGAFCTMADAGRTASLNVGLSLVRSISLHGLAFSTEKALGLGYPSRDSDRILHLLILVYACEGQISLPCQDGPGRLPSSLVRVFVSGLAAGFMVPGVIQRFLHRAGCA